MNITFDLKKYGMILCPLCEGKGFVINQNVNVAKSVEDLGILKKNYRLKETGKGKE